MHEYFLFDPYGEYLRPRLQGYRFVSGVYQPVDEYPLRSAVLGLILREEDNARRLYHPTTGKRLLTPEEAELARRAAEADRATAEEQRRAEAAARLDAETRAVEQAARAEAALAELARLRALLEQKEG